MTSSNHLQWFSVKTHSYLIKLEYSQSRIFKALCDGLVKQLLQSGYVKRSTRGLNSALKTLTLNLFLRYEQFAEGGVVNVYKSKEYFGKGHINTDYFGFSWESFNNALNGLEHLGYIKHQSGDIEINKDKSKNFRPTKILATEAFHSHLKQHLQIDLVKLPVDAIIEKKFEKKSDKKKEIYGFTGQKKLSKSQQELTRQRELQAFNELAQSTRISLADIEFSPVDTPFKRVFHNDFNTYGRLHNGLLQNLPKEYRPYLQFDGKPTVEVDIVSSHLLIAYGLCSNDLTEYPPAYELEGIDCRRDGDEAAKMNRKILKQCLINLINTKSIFHASESLREWYVKWERKNDYWGSNLLLRLARQLPEFNTDEHNVDQYTPYHCKLICEVLYKKHQPFIKDFLTKKNGSKLVYAESEILLDTVTHFVKKGVYCLPIHDSIRIEEGYAQELQQVFLDSMQKRLSINFKDPAKVLELEPVKVLTEEMRVEINGSRLALYARRNLRDKNFSDDQ